MQATSKPKLYNPRHPERTLLKQTVAEHYETWLELPSAGQFDGQGDHRTPKPYVRLAFEKNLECGIFAHGFASAAVQYCVWPRPKRVKPTNLNKSQATGLPLASNQTQCAGLGCKNLEPCLCSCAWTSYPQRAPI